MSTPVAIQGELTVFTAHELKSTFLGAMSPGGDLALDLADVTEFDGAGLQLLLASQREAIERGGQFQLLNLPTKVKAVLALAGLPQHFAASPAQLQEIAS